MLRSSMTARRGQNQVGLPEKGADDPHVTRQHPGKRVADLGCHASAGLDRCRQSRRCSGFERRVRCEDQALLRILPEALPVGDVEDEREAVRERPVERFRPGIGRVAIVGRWRVHRRPAVDEVAQWEPCT